MYVFVIGDTIAILIITYYWTYHVYVLVKVLIVIIEYLWYLIQFTFYIVNTFKENFVIYLLKINGISEIKIFF